MTVAIAFFARLTGFSFDRRISTRTAVLVLGALACVLYAVWRHTVPPGPAPNDVDRDTMCLISRIGLGGLCK
jgi:hypothetical protein